MKVVGKAPQWAVDLLTEICEENNRSLPGEFKWITGSSKCSSGSTFYTKSKAGRQLYFYRKLGNGTSKRTPFRGKILVNAGTSEEDAKHTLLYEIAHWIATRNKSIGHTVHFYKIAFRLYEKYELLEYSRDREARYKKTSISVYNKLYS